MFPLSYGLSEDDIFSKDGAMDTDPASINTVLEDIKVEVEPNAQNVHFVVADTGETVLLFSQPSRRQEMGLCRTRTGENVGF